MEIMMRGMQLLLAVGAVSAALPPSCDKPVYCNSRLLHDVQLSRIFTDSKSFVDHHIRLDENTTLAAYQQLLDDNNDTLTREQIQEFVETYFDSTEELEKWTPTDYSANPAFLATIRDPSLRQFGKDINDIWPTLGRQLKQDVLDNPEKYSFIPVPHGFIIPGGRFKELYYWDTYWIIEGLLISDMKTTVKGMLENLIQLLRTVGHIPNGSRWYYQQRSQPPLLTAMVSLYYRYTRDTQFLKDNIDSLEMEMKYWLDTQAVKFEKDGETFTLLRYDSESSGPRPESYGEDYNNSLLFDTEERREQFFIDIKSAAESGWDFSSRWFISENGSNAGNLSTIHTRQIIPVDLNSIFANALQNVAYFQAVLHNPREAAYWGALAQKWRTTNEKVFWDDEAGIWLDYEIKHQQHRKYFYPSNFAPLWMEAVPKEAVQEHSQRVMKYLKGSGVLDFAGGIPTSLKNTGEQWDLPNAWPPLISIVVNALEALTSEEAKETAFEVAQNWVRSNQKGFVESKQMFEKYDVYEPGKVGGGGEYDVQAGFGWSNGVVLEFLARYGRRMTLSDDAQLDKQQPAAHSSASHNHVNNLHNMAVLIWSAIWQMWHVLMHR